jgi:hypothetical protein
MATAARDFEGGGRVTDPTIDANSIISRAKDVIATEVDGEAVLMSIEKGQCYGFDRIGTRIWSLLERPLRFRDVCAMLLTEYDVDGETCRREVTRLLAELVSERLVVIGDEQTR